jgi:HlyD family secretion protein
LPKKPENEKKSGEKQKTNASSAKTVESSNSRPGAGTNSSKTVDGKKPGDAPKPIEVVFLVDGERVKMAPVKRGISDDAYVEITEGLQEDQEIVSGGYKAINRELEDGKKIKKGGPVGEKEKEEGK